MAELTTLPAPNKRGNAVAKSGSGARRTYCDSVASVPDRRHTDVVPIGHTAIRKECNATAAQ